MQELGRNVCRHSVRVTMGHYYNVDQIHSNKNGIVSSSGIIEDRKGQKEHKDSKKQGSGHTGSRSITSSFDSFRHLYQSIVHSSPYGLAEFLATLYASILYNRTVPAVYFYALI